MVICRAMQISYAMTLEAELGDAVYKMHFSNCENAALMIT